MDSQRPAVIGDFYQLYHITVRQWRMREYEHVPWRNQKTPHKHTHKNKTIPETKSWWWKHCWILRTWRLIWWHERRSIIKNSSINRTKRNQIIFLNLAEYIKIDLIITTACILLYFFLILNWPLSRNTSNATQNFFLTNPKAHLSTSMPYFFYLKASAKF